ncbi:MAG: hypothetical protein JNL57_10535 [Bacteroidetes bacterium]|nr:hypothetical protein [Bacteroidota bacterium]
MTRIFLALFTGTVFLLSSCGGSTSKSNTDTAKTKPKDTVATVAEKYDRKFNDYARFISGQPALNGSIFKSYDSNEQVKKQVTAFNARWADMEKNRLGLMRSWAKDELYPKVDENLNTFYPFSGPDFLHVYQFYPNSKKYLFLANEMVGDVPEFDKMSKQQVLQYLSSIESALNDIFRRSYFITSYMGSQIPRVKGVIPIFLVFLSRTGHEILNVEHIKLDADGKAVSGKSSSGVSGVRFTFRPEGKPNDIRTLEYINADISNEGTDGKGGLKAHPELVKFIESFGRANSFVKAASYLMHYGTFTTIKDLTMAKSASLLQDDTGIPYRLLKDKFKPFMYGKYTVPISNFSKSGHYQPDLAKLYATDSASVKALPFSLGYHWLDKNQNYMLFVAK